MSSPTGPAGKDAMGRSALHYAAVDGDDVAVRRLVHEGADVRAVGGRGFTPLHFAAQQGNSEGVRVLLAIGADPASPNAIGSSTARMVRLMERQDLADLMGVRLSA